MVFVQLSEFTERNQQSRFIELADRFVCRDNDVEAFLKTKALDNEIRHRSRTYLFLDDNAGHIAAYFTLALKTLIFGDNVSSSVRKKPGGFSRDATSIASVLEVTLRSLHPYSVPNGTRDFLLCVFYPYYAPNGAWSLYIFRAESPAHNSPGQRRLRRRPGLRNKNIQPPCKGKALWRSDLWSFFGIRVHNLGMLCLALIRAAVFYYSETQGGGA